MMGVQGASWGMILEKEDSMAQGDGRRGGEAGQILGALRR